MKIWKKITIVLVILIVAIQFIPTNRNAPAVVPTNDFIQIEKPPIEIATMIKNACYGCHSHETSYPWYSNVAPVSWWLDSHINEAREHLNFSTWGSNREKREAREECAEEIAEGEMPLQSYALMHSEARLSKNQLLVLATWFDQNTTKNSPQDSEEHEAKYEDEED